MGKELHPGYVVTVEPGIYFNKELIDRYSASGLFSDFINYPAVEKFRNFGGVRIEDDFVIEEEEPACWVNIWQILFQKLKTSGIPPFN
ncbi:M24 family metallopeptidase [Pedobacter panaciterrae]